MSLAPSSPVRARSRARIATLAVVGTALVTLVVWDVAQAVASLIVRPGSHSVSHIGAAAVLLVSVLAALVALARERWPSGCSPDPVAPGPGWPHLAAAAVLVVTLGPPASARRPDHE